MEVINDSLKKIALAKNLIKVFLQPSDKPNENVLMTAFTLLGETVDLLAQASSPRVSRRTNSAFFGRGTGK